VSNRALIGEELPTIIISYKRSVSIKLRNSLKRVYISSVYKDTSLRELRDFLLGYKVYFEAIEEYKPRRRIAIAALYLRKKALR
jgi:hypothetical protein